MTNPHGDIELTFLGTGTSQGVPMIGCDCAVCQSSDPRDQRTRSSVFIQTPEMCWVFDTGPDFRTQVLREKIRWLDAVVLTHSHTDHIMGFDDLRRFCDFLQGTMPIYGSPETLADLERAFSFAFNGQNTFPGYIRPEPRVIEGPFRLEKTELVPLRVKHGRAHVFGYLLKRGGEKRVAYLSDCKEVFPEGMEQIQDVPVLIVDALRHKSHPTHMNLEEALELARVTGARETWFTHICHDLPHAETNKILPEKVRLAFDGLKIRV